MHGEHLAPNGSSRPVTGSARPGVRKVTIRPRLDDGIAADVPRKSAAALIWDAWMLALTVGSLAVLAWVELRGLTWADATFRKLALVDLGIVVICFLEFAYRFSKAPNKTQFLKENWFDLPGLVPMYAESFAWLRAARILRVVRLARLLRLVYAARRISNSVAFVRRVFQVSRMGYIFSVFLSVAIVAAGAFWMIEGGKNTQISGFDDALWWSATTAATVGYGDVTPQTGLGRILAIAMMMFGLCFMGIITSSLSAALVLVAKFEVTEEVSVDAEDEQSARATSLASELGALAALREKGHLTDIEFMVAKSKLLADDAEMRPAR